MKVIIAGGGTGGHLFPAIAVGEALKRLRPGIELLLVGTSAGMEAKWLPGTDFRYELLAVHGVRGKGLTSRLRSSFEFTRAVVRALDLVRRFRPDVVLCVGGYASAPIGGAAIFARVPLVLQEQNTKLGLANQMMWRFARKVCVAFDETAARLDSRKVEVTGNPTRFQFHPGRPAAGVPLQILVLGGSTGAHRLNIGVLGAFKKYGKGVIKFSVTHQTGEADEGQVSSEYSALGMPAQVMSFIDDIPAALTRADLVIARGGGNTVCEIGLAGRAAIFVPYPFHPDMQQLHNARVFERVGAALVVSDDDGLAANLHAALTAIEGEPDRLVAMGEAARAAVKPHAAERIAELCLEIGEQAGA